MTTFTSDFGSLLYSAHKMLAAQAKEFKLKDDFKIKAVSICESRFPQHYEMFVEVDGGKSYVQLLKREGKGVESMVIPASCFTEIARPGVR